MFAKGSGRSNHVVQTLAFLLVLLWSQRLAVLQNQSGHRAVLAFDDVPNLVAPLVDRLHAISQVRILVMKRDQFVLRRVDRPGARRNRQQRSSRWVAALRP